MQHMAKGRVEQALSAAVASQKPPLPPRSASLESLLAFAANPIVLGALETRMRSHALRAKVNVLVPIVSAKIPPLLPPHSKYGSNYGLTLSLWDYLFKTNYIPHSGRDIELGFKDDEKFPKDFIKQEFYPLSKK